MDGKELHKDEIEKAADGLARLIAESAPRERYARARERIDADDAIAVQLRLFKRAHVEYQLKVLSDETPSFEEERAVSSLYAELMQSEDARELLEAEKALLELAARVEDTIAGAFGVTADY